MTSCWGVKKFETLQEEAGHAADGVPQDEGSMEFVALVTSDGTFFLCTKFKEHVSISRCIAYNRRDLRSRTKRYIEDPESVMLLQAR